MEICDSDSLQNHKIDLVYIVSVIAIRRLCFVTCHYHVYSFVCAKQFAWIIYVSCEKYLYDALWLFWMVCVWAVFCSSKITLWNTVSCHYNYANFSLLLLKSFLLVASSHHTTKLVLQSRIRRIGYFSNIGLLVNCR